MSRNYEVDPFNISPIYGAPDHAWQEKRPSEPPRSAINPNHDAPDVNSRPLEYRPSPRQPGLILGLDIENGDRTVRDTDEQLHLAPGCRYEPGCAAEVERDRTPKVKG